MAQLAPGAMALGGAVANQQVTKWRFLNMEKHGKTMDFMGFHMFLLRFVHDIQPFQHRSTPRLICFST